MIRKFEKNDLNAVMKIWERESIKAHKFIQKECWEGNYHFVKEILLNAEIYVYIAEKRIVGFVGLDNNYVEGIFVDINN